MFSKSFKDVTHCSSCDFKPPFVGSSIEAPVLSSSGASLAERSWTFCVTGSGDPQCGQNLSMSASSSIAALRTCSSGAGHGMLSHDASSSIERSTTLRVPVPGSASALRCKNMNGAGGPMCVGHGQRSSRGTSWRFAGSSDLLCGRKPGSRSSALKGKVVDGKAWSRRQSSDFVDSFVPCTSPSQRVHLVNSIVRLSSSQNTHDMHGDMNSCGSVHGVGA